MPSSEIPCLPVFRTNVLLLHIGFGRIRTVTKKTFLLQKKQLLICNMLFIYSGTDIGK